MNLAMGPVAERLLLVAGVVAIAAAHFDDHARPDPIALLLGRAEQAMQRAGFTVERRQEGWRGTRASGRRMLVARHPACAMPVIVEAMGALNPRHAGMPTYIYGTHSGGEPGYGVFAANALAMVWNQVLPWRHSPRPTVKMLAATDPSACLAITLTDWRWVWFGSEPTAAGDRR